MILSEPFDCLWCAEVILMKAALCIFAIACTIGGQQFAAAQQSAPPILPDHPKLDIDPTESLSITGWWVNGTELLLVREDGSFSWWDQPNRFRAPTSTGRWDRQNYRTFWLEPYFDRVNPHTKPPRIRGAMRRMDGVVTVTFGSYAPLRQSPAAPAAPEDVYVGAWSGPGGSLTLLADATYRLTTTSGAVGDTTPVSRSGHSGTWSYDGKFIVLRSIVTPKEPVVCSVVDRPADGTADSTRLVEVLTTPIGELRRVAGSPVKAANSTRVP